jgi:triacylglycerol lipase
MELGRRSRALVRAVIRARSRVRRRRSRWRPFVALSTVVMLAATATLAPAAASSAFAPAGSGVAAALGDRVVRFSQESEQDSRAVLLVHGWLSTVLPASDGQRSYARSPFSRPVQWRDGSGAPVARGMTASLQERLEAQPGVAVYAFDYSANSAGWVGSNGSADNLAAAIRSIADSVHGPVDIVTHSMGGLALRYALRDDPGIAALIGEVVTVAAPSQGSDIANVAVDIAAAIRATMSTVPVLQNLVLPWIGAVCNNQLATDARGGCDLPPIIRTGIAALGPAGTALRAGSADIAGLPDWPAGLHVHAIAGSAVVTMPLPTGRIAEARLGDGLVAEDSALAGASETTVITCRTDLPPGTAGIGMVLSGQVAAPPFGGACGHDAIFSNLEVVDAVLAALRGPAPT